MSCTRGTQCGVATQAAVVPAESASRLLSGTSSLLSFSLRYRQPPGEWCRFGLARSLDGVAAYLESARGGHHDEPHPWTGLDDAGITEDRRVREAKKAVTAAEKTLRDARRLERLAAPEARERLRRTGQG